MPELELQLQPKLYLIRCFIKQIINNLKLFSELF